MKNLGVHHLFTINLDGGVEEGVRIETFSANEGDSPGAIVGEKVGNQGWKSFLKFCLDPAIADWWDGKEVRVTQALLLKLSKGAQLERNYDLITGVDGSSAIAGAVVCVKLPYHEERTQAGDKNHCYRRLARGRFADPLLEPFKQGIFRLEKGGTMYLVSLVTGQPETLSYTFDGERLLRK